MFPFEIEYQALQVSPDETQLLSRLIQTEAESDFSQTLHMSEYGCMDFNHAVNVFLVLREKFENVH